MRKIAIITARFAQFISGGAEKLAWDYAKILSLQYDISVFTTTAESYITWKNHFREGSIRENGFLIHRFPVSKDRNMKRMNRILSKSLVNIQNNDIKLESQFLNEQGPFCPTLVEDLIKKQREYDLIIAIGYLYFPIVKILEQIESKVLVVPCLHPEPVLNLNIFGKALSSKFFYAFNAPEEEELYWSRFKKIPRKSAIIGTYVPIPNSKKTKILSSRKVAISIGRLDPSKGYSLLFEYWNNFKQSFEGEKWDLVILGSGDSSIYNTDQVRFLGFVSEEIKIDWLNKADVLINPSPYESFSISVMEAWANGCPVLVNASSAVTSGHCLRSSGGFAFLDTFDFTGFLNLISQNPNLSEKLGKNGFDYVQKNFKEEIVTNKLLNYIEELINC